MRANLPQADSLLPEVTGMVLPATDAAAHSSAEDGTVSVGGGGGDEGFESGNQRWEAHQRIAREHGVGMYAVSLSELRQILGGEGRGAQGRGEKKEWEGLVPVDFPIYYKGPWQQCNAGALQFRARIWKHPLPERTGKMLKPNLTWVGELASATASLDIMTLGDTFWWRVVPFGFITDSMVEPIFGSPCKLLLQPQQQIFDIAAQFYSTMLHSTPYAAVHLRVNGRYRGLTAEEAAKCIFGKVVEQGLTQVFVSTDKAEALEGFKKHVDTLGSTKAGSTKAPKVVAFENFRELSSISLILVEKILCAGSSIFFSTPLSTFSESIRLYRYAFNMTSCGDEDVCQGGKGIRN